MSRTYLLGIAMGVAVLGFALLGNESPRGCRRLLCAGGLRRAGLRHVCSGHVPRQALSRSPLPGEDLLRRELLQSAQGLCPGL